MRWKTVENGCRLLQPPRHEKKVVQAVGVIGKGGDEATGSQFQLQLLQKPSVDQAVDLAAVGIRPDLDDLKKLRILQQPPILQECLWPVLMALLTPLWERTRLTTPFPTPSLQAATHPHAHVQQPPNSCVDNHRPSPTSPTSKPPTRGTSRRACAQPLHQATARAVPSQTKQIGNQQIPAEAQLHLPTLKALWSTHSITKSRLTLPHQFPASISSKPSKAGATFPIQMILPTPPSDALPLATLHHHKTNHASQLLPQIRLSDTVRHAALALSIAVLRRKMRVMIWAMGCRCLWRRRGRLRGRGSGNERRRGRWRGSRLQGGRRGRD